MSSLLSDLIPEKQLKNKLMKTIKKNVYYCDFCKKRSLAAWSMVKHENICTANPNRECKMCENSINLKDDIEYFKSRFKLIENEDLNYDSSDIFSDVNMNTDEYIVEWIGEPVTIDELYDKYDRCPNCILAILRQTGMNRHYFHFDWDYKADVDEYMREKQLQQTDGWSI